MKQITRTRKAVCAMANELRKAGYSLTQAFRRAWKWVKCPIRVRAAGTAFGNRQERLQFLKQFNADDISVTLEREPENQSDGNAVQIVAHIKPISRKTVIGYVPRGIARVLAKAMGIGAHAGASLVGIIGGYSYKENLGALVEIRV